ncbi:MAG: ATP-binding cassette domain-containing protein [Bacillus sp. (in: firmicutes)]
MDCSLPKGRITSLISANGYGKSILLKAIARLHKPTQRHIYLDGKSVSGISMKEIRESWPYCLNLQKLRLEAWYTSLFPMEGILARETSDNHFQRQRNGTVDPSSHRHGRFAEALSSSQRQRAWSLDCDGTYARIGYYPA